MEIFETIGEGFAKFGDNIAKMFGLGVRKRKYL